MRAGCAQGALVRGKATVREIYQEMKPLDGEGDLAYTTVPSLLETIVQKGLVGRKAAGKVFSYPTRIGSVPMARL